MDRTSGCGARHGEGGLRRPSAVGRARLPAFHHGTCGSDQTPPLSSSHALPGAGLSRDGRYPSPAALRCSGFYPAGRSSCRPGVLARSRPGADRNSARGNRPRPDLPECLRQASLRARRPHRLINSDQAQITSLLLRHDVSRAQRGMERSGTMRCRPGIVMNPESAAVRISDARLCAASHPGNVNVLLRRGTSYWPSSCPRDGSEMRE
jgi:hypothetical protein